MEVSKKSVTFVTGRPPRPDLQPTPDSLRLSPSNLIKLLSELWPFLKYHNLISFKILLQEFVNLSPVSVSQDSLISCL